MGKLSGHDRAMLALDRYGVPRENGSGRLSLPERIELLGRQVPDLMGSAEAAHCLGVASGNLPGLAGLPQPVVRLTRGNLWLASDIHELAAKRGRR